LRKTYSKLSQRIKKFGYFNTSAEIVNKVLASNDDEPFAAIMSHPSALFETIIHCDLEIIGREFSARPCNHFLFFEQILSVKFILKKQKQKIQWL
jgi:hypothetical protein